ncbi:MAG: hypothetical protein OES13_00495 [Acidimicrobiia bacterium]|nr:hypothetical protein [Acidimicrobiia bacterium]
MKAEQLAASQLRRMRGMTALYHRLFFSDVRFTIVALLAVFAAGSAGVEPMFLAAAPIALLGGAQTAFDASYLIFARHYAVRLEARLNKSAGEDVLIAGKLEDSYLFPLGERKLVAVATGPGFSWFGYMTILYTVLGISAFVAGIAASAAQAFDVIGSQWAAVYLGVLGLLTATTMAVGWWWFPGGEGERRLTKILDDSFGE